MTSKTSFQVPGNLIKTVSIPQHETNSEQFVENQKLYNLGTRKFPTRHIWKNFSGRKKKTMIVDNICAISKSSAYLSKIENIVDQKLFVVIAFDWNVFFCVVKWILENAFKNGFDDKMTKTRKL